VPEFDEFGESTGTTSDRAPLRVAVAGAGAFGRNHLRVYRELEAAGFGVELAAVVDADAGVAAAAGAQFRVPWFTRITDCLAEVDLDAASVCVPTVHHGEAVEFLLAAGVDVLVEKPIAASLVAADRMVAVARKHGRILQVGHLERFNPAVTAARAHLHRPMFFESHRMSVFTPRSLDVDVVLDLMIHDLDIVLSLVDSPVREVRAVGLPVLSSKVDIANVRLEFENGCVANFTSSRVSTERIRKLRFFQPHQYLSLDFARQDLLLIDVTGAAGMSDAQLAALASMTGADQHPSEGLSMRKIKVDAGEPLRLELESFLSAVRERTVPVVPGEDGRRALGLALEIHAAMAAHARRAGI
jgi:predicted dehydrogenase